MSRGFTRIVYNRKILNNHRTLEIHYITGKEWINMGVAVLSKVEPIVKQERRASYFLETFHNEYKYNSENTARAYVQDLEQFLEQVSNLGVETPIGTVVNLINYKNVTDFRNGELDRGLKANTVNRKVTAIKEFGKHLAAHGVHVDMGFFSSIKSLKSDSASYEVLSIPEALQIAEWIKDNETVRGYEKFLYILLAIDTGVRAEALSNLTPENFSIADGEVLLKGTDKGKKQFNKRLSMEFYEDIKKNVTWEQGKKIFGFSAKNRNDMMNRVLKGLGWEHRNIVFHSFKKAAVNNAFDITGDIMIAMKTGGHSSVTTTQRYIAEGETFMGAISNANAEKMKELKYEDFTKEELIDVLKGMSDNFQYQMRSELLKMLEE